MTDIPLAAESPNPHGAAQAGVSARRDDLRLFLAVVAVILSIVGVGLFLQAAIVQLGEQLGARITGVETRITGIEARLTDVENELRQLNTRVGRLEGALGLAGGDRDGAE